MYLNRFFWLIVLFSPSLAGYGQSWAELYTSAQASYENGDNTAALASINQSLSLFLQETDQTVDNHAAILRLIQVICYETGDFEAGLDMAKKELTLRQFEKNIPYAETLGQVGSFQQALEDFVGAEAAFRQAHEIYRQFYQPADAPVVESLLNIGICLYHQNRQEDAYLTFKEALANDQEEITPSYVQASYYFGQLCADRGEYENAVTSFEKVKAYYEAAELTESPDYAALLTSLAQTYHQSGEWDSADQLYALGQNTYEAIGDLSTDYYKLLNARAINFQMMRAPDKAEALLSKIPQDALKGALAAVILSNRATSSKANNDLAGAEKYYREALIHLKGTDSTEVDLHSETLQNLAVVLSEQGNTQEALQLLKEAESLVRSDLSRMIPLLIKKGIVLLKSGDRINALAAFRTALDNLEQNRKYSAEWVMALNGIGSVYTTDGDIESADSVFTVVLSGYRQNRITRDGNYPVILNNYASVQQMKGQFLMAYDLFYEAADYLKKETGENTLLYATALENLAHVNINRGALTVARGQIDSAIMIIEKRLGAKSVQYAMAEITLGRYFQNAGDFPAAEPRFKSAYSHLRDNENSSLSGKVRAINALAIFYQTLGNYEEAEPLFKESLARIEQSGGTSTAEYSTTLQNLATLYQIQGKLALATPLLERTLEIDEKVFGDGHPQYVIALKNLGVLYQKQGKLDDAQVLLERALRVTENVHGQDHPSYAVTISNLAALYQDQRKYDEAEKAWQHSVALRKKILGEEHPDYARSLYGLANIYFAQGNLAKADEYFRIVVTQYLKQIRENFPFMSEKEKGAFYLKIQPVFEAYQDFCVQYVQKNPDRSAETLFRLYDIQLATKAILLNASAKIRQQILATNNAEVITAYHQWLGVKEMIGRYYTLTAEERKGHKDIAMLQHEANELEKELSRTSEIFRDQFNQREYTAQDVKEALTEGEASVEIIRIRKKFNADSIYYVGLILKKEMPAPSLVIWDDGLKLENRYYRYHRNTIRFMQEDTLSFDRFWKPLATELEGIKHVYISSDGIFNKVNLSTLQDPVDQRWVVDDFTLSLVSNTREILERNTADHALTKDVHLYGFIDFNLKMDEHHVATHPNALTRNFGFDGDIPVLPGTEKEVNQIFDLVQAAQWNVSVHMRAEADEESMKKIVNPKILHVATHGFFLNDIDIPDNEEDDAGKFLNNPLLRSGLLLAGAGVKVDDRDATVAEDGILTAYEAMNLTLDHTDLVVMSACETGLGEVRNGEGVYGLQRSFLVAGASAVMMSLWQVDDTATQKLMVKFYSNWMAGDNKLDAFRKAQLSMKEEYGSPYYWGAFIMVGY